MSSNKEEGVSLEEVENVLAEIENKYHPNPVLKKSSSTKDFPQSKLYVLSKEFDTLGLPTINFNQSSSKIFQDVIINAHSLIQMHRQNIALMKDVELTSQSKRLKNANLTDTIEDYKKKVESLELKYCALENKLVKSNSDVNDLKKRESFYKEEMDKLKRYHKAKQNELSHQINRLTLEKDNLQVLFGKDIGTYVSKDDVTAQLIHKYKSNEEIYKKSIQKLEDNNKQLIQEVIDLKQELTLISNK